MSLDRTIQTGTYVGNGSSQTVTIGWQPALVYIVSTRTTGNPSQRGFSIKMSEMSGQDFFNFSSGSEYRTANGITLTNEGFSVGSDDSINRSAVDFHWVALQDRYQIDVGSYVGNYPTVQNVSTGRQPCFVTTISTNGSAIACYMKNSAENIVALDGYRFDPGNAVKSNVGTTIVSTGFSITGSPNPNENGTDYVYAAFYSLVGSTRHFECGQYSGDGVGDVTVTLGKQPRVLWLWAFDPGTQEDALFKSETMSGSDHAHFIDIGNFAWNTTPEEGVVFDTASFIAGATSWNISGQEYFWLVGYE